MRLGPGRAAVGDAVFEHDENPQILTLVAVVNEHRSLGEQTPMAFEDEIDRRGEQRMARGEQLGRRLPRDSRISSLSKVIRS